MMPMNPLFAAVTLLPIHLYAVLGEELPPCSTLGRDQCRRRPNDCSWGGNILGCDDVGRTVKLQTEQACSEYELSVCDKYDRCTLNAKGDECVEIDFCETVLEPGSWSTCGADCRQTRNRRSFVHATQEFQNCDHIDLEPIYRACSGPECQYAVPDECKDSYEWCPSMDHRCGHPLTETYCALTCGNCGMDPGAWFLVLQYNTPYTPDGGAVGDLTKSPSAGFAKLSDEQINNFDAAADGYFYYKLVDTGDSDSPILLVRTQAPFADEEQAFGWNLSGGGYEICEGGEEEGAHETILAIMSCQWVLGHSSRFDTEDQFGNTCGRWFADYRGEVDCYGMSVGERCFSKGVTCNHTPRDNVMMYKWSPTGVLPEE